MLYEVITHRKIYKKGCTVTFIRFKPDLTPMIEDYSFDNRQAQPGSFTFCSKIGVKYLVLFFRGNAGACILNPYPTVT